MSGDLRTVLSHEGIGFCKTMCWCALRNYINMVRPPLESVSALVKVVVSIVDTNNASDRVIEAALGYMRCNAYRLEMSSSRPPKIMNCEMINSWEMRPHTFPSAALMVSALINGASRLCIFLAGKSHSLPPASCIKARTHTTA